MTISFELLMNIAADVGQRQVPLTAYRLL